MYKRQEKGCNSLLKIDYTITLNESLPLKDGRTVNVTFNQNQGIKLSLIHISG